MANIRDIRTRIVSIEKIQKIVRAMKMISAAKLARATHALQNARPYADKLEEVLSSVASGVSADSHPLIQPRDEVRKLDVVLFTSDRSMCGAFNSKLIKHAEQLIAQHRQHDVEVSLVPVGKRGREHFERRSMPMPAHFDGLGTIALAGAG